MRQVGIKSNSHSVIALIVVSVLVLAGGIAGYVAVSGKLRTLTAEQQEKQKQVDEATEIARTLEESRLKFDDTLVQLRNLEATVSTQAYVPTLLKQLEEMGKLVSLKVLSVRPVKEPPKPPPPVNSEKDDKAAKEVKPEPPKPYDEQKINIEVQGKYVHMLDFVYKLTSFPKIIAVNSITVAPITASRDEFVGGSPDLRVSLNITAYILKEAAGPGTEASGNEPPEPAGANAPETVGVKT